MSKDRQDMTDSEISLENFLKLWGNNTQNN